MTKKTKLICSVIAAAALIVLLICSYELTDSTSMLRSVLQLGAIYALAAVSMNLLNGVTGLFSLGQAGFMAVGAYTFAIFTIPVDKKAGVYYLYGVADGLAGILGVVDVQQGAGLVGRGDKKLCPGEADGACRHRCQRNDPGPAPQGTQQGNEVHLAVDFAFVHVYLPSNQSEIANKWRETTIEL